MPGVGGAAGRLGDDGDAQHRTRRRLGELDGQRQRIADVGAGDGEQPGADVGDAAGHHALDGHQLEHDRLLDRGQRRGVRHDARRRLDRGDAAAVGRVAQRAADVVAEPERAHPAGQRRALAAARSAGGDGRVPRVAGQAAQRRVGVHAQAEVGQVGPGERDRPGRPHAARRPGRRSAAMRVLERRHAVGRGRAGDVDVLLDGDRHAVERRRGRRRRRRPGRLASAAAAASGSRATTALRSPLTCSIRAREGVEDLAARRLLLADHVGELQRAQLPEFGHRAQYCVPRRHCRLPVAAAPSLALGRSQLETRHRSGHACGMVTA